MPATLTKNGDVLELKLEGRWSEISDAKDKVKEIPGRRFDFDKKIWTVPADPATADRLLKTIRPTCSEELMAWLRESMTSHEESLTSPLPPDAKLLLPWSTTRMPWQPEVVNDEKFNGLLPWQRAAVRKMADAKHMLLCDDMGLGKTFETISAIEEHILGAIDQPQGPRLIIAPSSVLGSWNRELNRWLKEPHVQIADAKDSEKRHQQIRTAIEENAWVIVNWEQLRIKKLKANTKRGSTRSATVMKEPLFQYPQAWEWDLPLSDWTLTEYAKADRLWGKEDPYWLAAVADEIHRAKNKDAQQTKGLYRVTARLMYGLTGTPIMNSPDELWSLLRWLWPNEYHEAGERHATGAIPYWTFYNTHVDYWEDHHNRKVVTGVKNPDALRYALKDRLIRRTAAILNLKGRKRIPYPVDLTPKQQKLYNDAETAIWLAIQKDASAGDKTAIELARKAAEGGTVTKLMRIPNGAARFVRLQQIIENAALIGGPDESANMDDFVQKFVDSRPNQWIVFCKFVDSCELLAARLRKVKGLGEINVAIYNGNTSNEERTEIEDAYQRGEIDVVIGTIDAMYQGITLTSGHLQHWLSRALVPAKNEQGEARQDRLGQQELVRVYIPEATNTVAAGRVRVINTLKEGIVKTVIPQDEIKEGIE